MSSLQNIEYVYVASILIEVSREASEESDRAVDEAAMSCESCLPPLIGVNNARVTKSFITVSNNVFSSSSYIMLAESRVCHRRVLIPASVLIF